VAFVGDSAVEGFSASAEAAPPNVFERPFDAELSAQGAEIPSLVGATFQGHARARAADHPRPRGYRAIGRLAFDGWKAAP
jgi:hypothetical protein